MRALVVEDEYISRKVLQKFLAPMGEVTIVVDGNEALDAFSQAWADGKPYDLICLDIMMPGLDGQTVLKKIRDMEDERGVPTDKMAKIVMTTALKDSGNILGAFGSGCEAYLVKPLDREKFRSQVEKMGLLDNAA